MTCKMICGFRTCTNSSKTPINRKLGQKWHLKELWCFGYKTNNSWFYHYSLPGFTIIVQFFSDYMKISIYTINETRYYARHSIEMRMISTCMVIEANISQVSWHRLYLRVLLDPVAKMTKLESISHQFDTNWSIITIAHMIMHISFISVNIMSEVWTHLFINKLSLLTFVRLQVYSIAILES